MFMKIVTVSQNLLFMNKLYQFYDLKIPELDVENWSFQAS